MINVIIYGSMMNYMKRKGTWECGSAVRNKQTNNQKSRRISVQDHFRVDNLTTTTRIYFVFAFYRSKLANPAEV